MNYHEFNKKRNELVNALEKMEKSALGEKCSESIRRCIEKIRDGRFRISVFGTFSTGKSTLLNALMQFKEEILTVDELACTAAVTVLQSPPEPSLLNKAQVIFTDPDRKPELVPIENVSDYSAKKRTEGRIDDSTIEDEIKEVRLYVESPLLQNGVEIVDTPGLNSAYEKHTEISMQILKESDATIFMFDFEQAGTRTEFSFMNLLSENLRKAFLTLNQIDKKFDNIDAEEQIAGLCEDLRSKLQSQNISLGEKKIYPISAKYAFLANKSAERRERDKKLEQSRITDLTNAMEQYLTGPEFEHDKLYVPLMKLQASLGRLRDENQKAIEAASSKKNEIEGKLKENEKQLKEEKNTIDTCAGNLKKLIDAVFNDKRNDMDDKAEDIAKEISEDLNKRGTAYRMKRFLENGGYVSDLQNSLERYWIKVKDDLLSKLRQIVIQTVDPDEAVEEAIVSYLSDITEQNLSFTVISCENSFEIDMSEVDGLREKLEATEKNLKRNADSLAKYRKESEKRSDLLVKREELTSEIRRLRSNIDLLYSEKAKVRDTVIYEKKYYQQQRGGWLGKLADKLVGQKTVEREERVVHTDDADAQRKGLTADIEIKKEGMQQAMNDLERINSQISDSASVEVSREYSEWERTKLYKMYNELHEMMQKAEDEAEQEQVADMQKKLNKEVETLIEEFIKIAAQKLEAIKINIKKFAVRIVEQSHPRLAELLAEKEAILGVMAASDEDRAELITRKSKENEQIELALHTLEVLVKG